MASLKDTKRRIGSVKNTQKITRAMKLVAAAKFARANQAAVSSRPYAAAFERMVGKLSAVSTSKSPLLERRDPKRVLAVVMTSDKGLCGGLNSNLIKKSVLVLKPLVEAGIEVEMIQWGKRGSAVARTLGLKVASKAEKILEKPEFSFASQQSLEITSLFESKHYDQVLAFYPKFENAMTQRPECIELLPFGTSSDVADVVDTSKTEASFERVYVFEPSSDLLLESLLKKQVSLKLYRMMLEGSASEHAARMTAMDSATNNAEDVIKKLTLDYNRARQAAITTELIEITSGAEAL